MRSHYKIRWLVVWCMSCALPLFAAEGPAAVNAYHVRVLLDAQDIGTGSWCLSAPGGFIVYDRDDRAKKDVITSESISVHCTGRGIEINNKRYMSQSLVLVPARTGQPIAYDMHSYQGLFIITCVKERALLINRVELEDYIFSVLRTESFPSWPLEVNKVFAIASRTYVISMIMKARKTGMPYHVRNTNHHQTYTGIHQFEHLRTAVSETRGIFIAHKGNPILAMFDVCCGGIIPAHMSDFDFVKAPYLARTYPCTFCKSCKVYNWHVFYSFEQLLTCLQSEMGKVKHIHDIRVVTKDKAGLVKKVTIHGHKIAVPMTGKRMYSVLKNIRSFCFSAEKRSDGITFTGRGYGHHIGICQWGAREMVRDGHDYRAVLAFYYPGTTCMRLQYGTEPV